jgi:hypothetical protein
MYINLNFKHRAFVLSSSLCFAKSPLVLQGRVSLSTCHDSKVKSVFVIFDMMRGFVSVPKYLYSTDCQDKKILHMEDKQANNCRMYAGLYILVISYASGPLTSNGNASETKANESFDNSVFFDIEAKRTPSLERKLFSKRSEHIR